MKKIIKYLMVGAGVMLLCLFMIIGSFRYAMKYKITEVGTEISADGKFVVVFQMIGEPEWPFGSTHVQMIIKRADGIVIEKIKESIQDDGSIFREENWSVGWRDNLVEITLKGSEQEDEKFVVLLE